MHAFRYVRAESIAHATHTAAAASTAQQGASIRYIAGGTTLLDLMKLDVEQPQQVIDINALPLAKIETTGDGGLKIGALVRNADLASHEVVKRDYPVLSEALLSGASAQLRNMATTSGNLLQRTRCMYFRDTAMACNKRHPGSGCAAMGGANRMLAVMGTSEQCIASNPSDMNVAMTALQATVVIHGPKGAREVPIDQFFLQPGDTPQRENVLEPGDLITHVILPPPASGSRSHYLKLRDRASYEFALASAAVIATVQDGRVTHARMAMGGIGTVPWRRTDAESQVEGNAPDKQHFAAAANAMLRGAKSHGENGFKIELARRCLIHALDTVTTAPA